MTGSPVNVSLRERNVILLFLILMKHLISHISGKLHVPTKIKTCKLEVIFRGFFINLSVPMDYFDLLLGAILRMYD